MRQLSNPFADSYKLLENILKIRNLLLGGKIPRPWMIKSSSQHLQEFVTMIKYFVWFSAY